MSKPSELSDAEIREYQEQVRQHAAWERYQAAAHKMQSGVAAKLPLQPDETTPKHLRVGVNSAMVETSALAKLLLDKGVFTRSEYMEAVADGMEAEAGRYQEELEQLLGAKVDLL